MAEVPNKIGQRFQRLQRIVRTIKTQPQLTSNEVYTTLEISKSQYYKDKKELEKLGFKYKYIRKFKAHQILQDTFLGTVELSFSEALSLVVALKQVSVQSDYALVPFGIQAVQKIIASSQNETMREALRSILNDFKEGSSSFEPKMQILETLWEAVFGQEEDNRTKRLVTLCHRSTEDGQIRSIRFYPYVIFFAKRALYVDGYRPGPEPYKGFRTFRIGRIQQVTLTGTSQPMREEYNFEQRRKHVYHLLGAGQDPIELRLRFSAKAEPYIREVKWHSSQHIESLQTGGCVLSLYITEPKEAIRDFASWGPEMEVVHPPEMRAWHREQLQKMIQKYT